MEYRDIRYEVIGKLHPYYLQPYFEASKEKLLEFEDLKYDYLQLWIWPNRSVLEIKQMLPNISLKDTVELCLFYHPIPESIGKFDEISLFLSSCRIGQLDPLIYIRTYPLDITVIGWICYKYSRLDIVDRLVNEYLSFVDGGTHSYSNSLILTWINQLQTFHNMIVFHINPKAQIINVKLTGNMYNFLISAIYLLSRNELLEAIIILSKLSNDEGIFNYLTGIDKTFSSISTEFDSLIINIMALSNMAYIDELLYKYYPDVEIHSSRFRSPIMAGFWNNTGDYNNLDYHLHPELIDRLDLQDQLIFHLTSGNYDKYIQLRNRDVPLVIDSDIMLGNNGAGYATINKEFQNRFNIYVDTEPELSYLRLDINDPETYLFLDPLDKPYIFS